MSGQVCDRDRVGPSSDGADSGQTSQVKGSIGCRGKARATVAWIVHSRKASLLAVQVCTQTSEKGKEATEGRSALETRASFPLSIPH